MSKKYRYLLSPLKIGNTVIKNRMVYPNASPHFLQGPETFPAESYIAFVSGLARNGAGIVTVAEWDNYPQQRTDAPLPDFSHMQAFDLKDPSVHNYLCFMADEVHFYDSKLLIAAQIKYPEGYDIRTNTLDIIHQVKPPGSKSLTAIPFNSPIKSKKMLPREMIPQVIDEYVEKVKLYQSFGYDGMTIRIEDFLERNKNNRTDDYGGSLENRARFILEIFARIKQELGPDFITEAELAGERPYGYHGGNKLGEGYTVEDLVTFAKLAEGKIDILQLRERDAFRSHPLGFNFKKGEHGTIGYSMAIKAAGCKILTQPIGGFQDPDEIETYLAEGKCDIIGMARAFIAEPEYGIKVFEDRSEDIIPCLWCNLCHGNFKPPWTSVCSVNPLLGIEYKLKRLIKEPGPAKKVAVIGGGPAGMRAALEAAKRGHSVTLYEKSGVLGGQLLHSDSYSFKWPIRDYKNWLIRSIKKAGVKVILNTAPTPELIKSGGFDAVIAATGAKANLPSSIKGLKDAKGAALYPTCIDIFGKESRLGKKVIMVGGSETGIETAMYLAENGHDVTVLTRQDELAKDASHLHYITMSYMKLDSEGVGHSAAAWEKYDNLKGILKVTTKSVAGKKVTYAGSDGVEHTIEGDSVVICGGMSPRVDEALAYADSAEKFFIVGDANGCGNLQRCNSDAYSKACMI
jgi:2,4-dienoyl-CoA reductase-like NADH-dependent reductase (Old Yellow Enzyme family)/NADPH-dependent 2,4-dienoyl-CoA reductase/sulfur reductase-like enzyme